MHVDPELWRKRLVLAATWSDRPMSLGEFIRVNARFLSALLQLHPIFSEIRLIRGLRLPSPSLDRDLSNLAPFLRAECWHPSDRPLMSMLDADGRPTESSYSPVNFKYSFQSLATPERDIVGATIRAGATSDILPGSVVIDLPAYGAPEFDDFDFIRSLVGVVVEHWHPRRASVSSEAFLSSTGMHEGIADAVGWLNYFDRPADMSAIPSDMHVERVGEHGVLLAMQHELLLRMDRSSIAKAVRVQRALERGGWFPVMPATI